MAKLVETGEKDKLKEMLRERLVQCGWRDELKEFCKDVIRKKGLEKVTVEELVADITPQGRGKQIFMQRHLYDHSSHSFTFSCDCLQRRYRRK